MNYNKFLIIFFLLITACSTYNIEESKKIFTNKKGFKNSGFTLVYSDKLYNQKIISKKMDNRGLVIWNSI